MQEKILILDFGSQYTQLIGRRVRERVADAQHAVTVEPTGGRLGRGRGFYDRMLAKARPDALKLGICFEIQLVADTFPEPHDVRMDHVIAG